MTADGAGDALGVLDRMTSILEAFGDDDRGLGISELAARAGLPKSTVSRLVSTLVRQHYLERDGSRIHLGLRLFELGQLAAHPRELRIAALPVMTDLRNRTGHHVHLAIRDGDDVVCIAALRGRWAEGPFPRTGARLVGDTAHGRALRADGPVVDVDGDTRCVACPVADAAGAAVASISVSGPAAEVDLERAVLATRAAARALSGRWGDGGL
ncbi:IclR family transcriptional regulator [Microbacterium hominis]|uniref:Glycerol operon regulatory protein n=1 Tax=Microbacterium hominis TaxID=162426 RepID=A0A7D4U314_9MICO|nr:helix-turn-helix domain-containing protein [Microbacterium hominis]QKJ18325.1 helix-turn-helix domain-containing protein [Microbacterium hominis]